MRILIYITFFICQNCYAQWFTQQSGTSRHLLGIFITDSNTGYICGDMVGGIIKTTNAGSNWIIYPEPTGDQYNSISFINSTTGITVGPPGLILRTSNGGINWIIITQPGADKGDVQFVSSNVAYAVGDDIIKSTDGGLTWTLIFNGYLSQYQGIYFTDFNNGTVVGLQGTIYTTTNGGSTWIQRLMILPVQFGDSSLYDVKYVNTLVGFACGNNGIFIKTTNGGINWIYYSTGAINALQGIYFLDDNTGYACGNAGRIIKTTNTGVNWITQTSGTTNPLNDIDFVNTDTGWAVGFNGTILKTTNGGVAWVKPIGKGVPSGFELYQNYPNPFNPATRIRFDIPPLTQIGIVTLKVFDIIGNEVVSLVNEKLNPGAYEVEWDGSNFSSGIYFYRLTADGFTQTKKMLLVK